MKTYCTVHVIAQNASGEFIVLQRAKHRSSPGKWNCITGYIEERESAEDAAVRELKEETNLEGTLVKTAEPYWKDSRDTRWIVIPSLIKISNIEELKIDENESQAYKWITPKDEIVKNSEALTISLKQLNID
jgi:8-oxo-dGTP diphosphatase